jgi:hypothetical protein
MTVDPAIRLGWYSADGLSWQGKDPNKNVLIFTEPVTPELISTMGMTMKEGRDFHPDASSEVDNIIINESLARAMGKPSVVGEIITGGTSGNRPMKVIGVVKDFVAGDVYSRAPVPLILVCDPGSFRYLTIRLKPSPDLSSSLAKVEGIIKGYNTEYPFEYTFLDEDFDKLFKTEALVEKLACMFGGLAVFISCLGLFGLAAYTAQRRSKEIGIRKLLGASVNGLTSLISSDFLKLVGSSVLIAFPIAWWVMHDWLLSYEYRTPIYWWVFALVGALTLIITLLTVGFQTLKAALRNPTEVLRTE